MGTSVDAMVNPTLLRAAAYCRVSTDRQAEEGVSLQVQEAACRNYAKEQGWTLLNVYIDDESSYAPRLEYGRMLQAAVDREFSVLLVWDFSRFGRDISQSPADVARLERLGVKVVAVSSPHAGRLERNIHFVLSDYYSYELGRKVKPSQIARVQDGLWVSRAPVGYKLEAATEARPGRKAPKRLAVDPEAGPKVARLFVLFASGGQSLNSLVKEADALGLHTQSGRSIARSHIAALLRNPVYIGQVVYNRRSLSKFEKKGARPQSEWVTAQGQHPPIVDPDTFRKCDEILSRHQKAYGVMTGGRPLLTGALYCGACGGKMIGRGRWRRTGKNGDGPDRYHYITYRCYRHELYRDCTNGSYHGGKRLEEWVKSQLMRLPITDEDREAARKEVRRILRGEMGNVEQQRKALQDQRDGHMEDLKALSWRLVRDEIPAPVYAEMRKEKEAAIADIDRQLATLTATASMDQATEDALTFLKDLSWADFDDQAWKEAIAALIERIVLEDKGQYRIEWRPGIAALLRPA